MKFGTLRYYIGTGELLELACCTPLLERFRAGDSSDAVVEAYDAHGASDEHVTTVTMTTVTTWQHLVDHHRQMAEKMYEIVTEYEDRSAHTCEASGEPPGVLMDHGGRYRTLNPKEPTAEYTPVEPEYQE